MNTGCRHWFGALLIIVMSGAPQAQAAMLTFGGTFSPTGSENVTNAKVEATFSNPFDGSTYANGELFTLTLKYLSATVKTNGHFDNGAVLTGFIWEMPTNADTSIRKLGIGNIGGTNTTSGASVGAGSQLVDSSGNPVSGTDISKNWAFSQPPQTPTGVGAAGGSYPTVFDFGNNDLIVERTPPVDPPLGGTDFGLVAPGYATTYLGGSEKAWVQSKTSAPTSVVFTFKVLDGTLSLTDIKTPKILFGSGLESFSAFLVPEDSGQVVPEPGSIAAMLSLVSFGFGAFVVRRRRAKKLAA